MGSITWKHSAVIQKEKLELLAATIREERNQKIQETDYMFRSDYPISTEKLELVKAYCQQLRDITNQSGFPENVIWPEKTW